MLGLIACWSALVAQSPGATIQADEARRQGPHSSHPRPTARSFGPFHPTLFVVYQFY